MTERGAGRRRVSGSVSHAPLAARRMRRGATHSATLHILHPHTLTVQMQCNYLSLHRQSRTTASWKQETFFEKHFIELWVVLEGVPSIAPMQGFRRLACHTCEGCKYG